MASKHEKEKQKLEDEFNEIEKAHNVDMNKYLVSDDETLPGFGEVELYNYDNDVQRSRSEGQEILKDLVDLYLGDANDDIKNHPYIKTRMNEDAEYYSQMKMIQKISERLLLKQMRQIDSGDISPKMYEITTKQISEMRENVRDGRNARLEIEKMYKEMRKDLGLTETMDNNYEVESDDTDGVMLDNEKMNEHIDQYLKNRGDDG